MLTVRYQVRVRRFALSTFLIPVYAVLLLVAVLTIPLRIPEILQVGGTVHFSFPKFMGWVATAPDAAPLNFLVQLPFVLALGASRFAVRLPSYLFALGSCYLFLKLVKRTPVRRPYLALLLFMLLPTHLLFATEGRPFEQALFFLLLATTFYLRLVGRPAVKESLLYCAALTLCLYTEPYSYFPAVGYLLALFRFVDQAQQRRTAWFALPATVVPVLLFLPYYFWARPQISPDWFSRPPLDGEGPSAYVQAFLGFAGQEWIVYILPVLLLAGILAGAWRFFRAADPGSLKECSFVLFIRRRCKHFGRSGRNRPLER